MTFTEYTLDNTPINARIAHNAQHKCTWRALNRTLLGPVELSLLSTVDSE